MIHIGELRVTCAGSRSCDKEERTPGKPFGFGFISARVLV